MKVYVKGSLTVSEICEGLNAKIVNPCNEKIKMITTDSRDLCEGSLFIAIKGEKFDGNDYVESAYEKGAVCALCQRIPQNFKGCAIIVDDVVKSLGYIAKAYKEKLSPLTIAVTGSVGKTTTKEFIYAVLSEKYKTLKTEGNFNSDIGLPMTLFALSPDDEAAVLEMGMSAKGEIENLSRIACPKIAVITNIGSSHIGKLGSREAIRDAKLEIRSGLQSDGVLILNKDEPLLDGIKGAVYVSSEDRKADVYVCDIIEGENGCAFDLYMNNERYESVVIPALGKHNVMNSAFAWAVGVYAGLGEFEIRRGLMKYKGGAMRQEVIKSNERTIIEDCYNASPESMKASLAVLSDMAKRKNTRKVAVLGDMKELGEYSKEYHGKVGAAVVAYDVDLLFTIGKDAIEIAKSASRFGMPEENIRVFEDPSDAETIAGTIFSLTEKDDIILVKASRALSLERIVECFKNLTV